LKMLCAVTLMIMRLETFKEKLTRLCRKDVKKIYPQGYLSSHNNNFNESNSLRSNNH